jgi:CxxC motif-containing protein (DUF1111 family)
MTLKTLCRASIALSLVGLLGACAESCDPPPPEGHGALTPHIMGRLGDPVPFASAEQLATFERGRAVLEHRFTLADGLGPAFNVTFCGSCHEKPVFGGSAGLYRNFFLAGIRTDEGAFFPVESAGEAGGVVRLYAYDAVEAARPAYDPGLNTVTQRNPIPFFGVGLIAEIPDEELLKRADPDDLDGDGISGRPNYDRGFVGRFGRKSQTVSIEGFIRGPLFNHLGVTTDPLTEAQRAQLPVDSSGGGDFEEEEAVQGALNWIGHTFSTVAQAAAPAGPLTDDDDAPDPEMTTDELFDLVSFAMLLAAPRPEPLNAQREAGMKAFDAVGCNKCHTPRVHGPRGPVHAYSDFLLHDMGEELDDEFDMKEATGSEFRTQPLWGIASVGPYLHDGRAKTIDEAILWHGGEATGVRDAYAALEQSDKDDLIEFLLSLGGRDQFSNGLIPPDEARPEAGAYGGPVAGLGSEDEGLFWAGRQLFDFEFTATDGVGSPRFNGDSCRACHFEPVVGGAGPRGVNVTRHGILNEDGEFTPPTVGTILHRSTSLLTSSNKPQAAANIFEHRQTPHLFGLGLVETIDDATILALADEDDSDGDGISGKASWTDGGRLGRFGWKAQVPSLAEFVRDAVTAELGMTLPPQDGLTFGAIHDNDDVADPEMSLEEADLMLAYLKHLGPPPRLEPTDAMVAARGEEVFESVGCTSCHVPSLEGADGPVPLYSDLLLHEILPPEAAGIEDASANMREFRTAPLWGISQTAPYLHSGAADTLDEAIRLHDGEAATVRTDYEALPEADREALQRFLETL